MKAGRTSVKEPCRHPAWRPWPKCPPEIGPCPPGDCSCRATGTRRCMRNDAQAGSRAGDSDRWRMGPTRDGALSPHTCGEASIPIRALKASVLFSLTTSGIWAVICCRALYTQTRAAQVRRVRSLTAASRHSWAWPSSRATGSLSVWRSARAVSSSDARSSLSPGRGDRHGGLVSQRSPRHWSSR
jgi:hypothetical protein